MMQSGLPPLRGRGAAPPAIIPPVAYLLPASASAESVPMLGTRALVGGMMVKLNKIYTKTG